MTVGLCGPRRRATRGPARHFLGTVPAKFSLVSPRPRSLGRGFAAASSVCASHTYVAPSDPPDRSRPDLRNRSDSAPGILVHFRRVRPVAISKSWMYPGPPTARARPSGENAMDIQGCAVRQANWRWIFPLVTSHSVTPDVRPARSWPSGQKAMVPAYNEPGDCANSTTRSPDATSIKSGTEMPLVPNAIAANVPSGETARSFALLDGTKPGPRSDRSARSTVRVGS